jgi:hypothetical protein
MQIVSAMNDCVTDQFIGVLQHTQQHVIDEQDKSAYDAEAAEWSADLWAQTGSGLPEGFYENRRSNATTPAAADGRSEDVTTNNLDLKTRSGGKGMAAGVGVESSQGSPKSDDEFASMSAAELSAQVDSMLTPGLSVSGNGKKGNGGEDAAEASGRQPRQP